MLYALLILPVAYVVFFMVDFQTDHEWRSVGVASAISLVYALLMVFFVADSESLMSMLVTFASTLCFGLCGAFGGAWHKSRALKG